MSTPTDKAEQIKNDRMMRTAMLITGASLVSYFAKDSSIGVAVFLIGTALRTDTIHKE